MQIPKLSFKNLELSVLCLCGFLLNFSAFYPGFISPDTLSQYEQALNNSYDTWHPPVMAYTWHLLNKIYQGPQVMLAWQLAFLWISCYLFASSFKNSLWRILVFILFGIAPFIQNFSGWIVKDSLMGLSWLLATAIMFKTAFRPGKPGVFSSVAACVLIIYGTWMRYNAITALPPLCILWAWQTFRNKKPAIKLGISAALILVSYYGQHFFNNVIVKAGKTNTDIQIYFHDIAGVFVKSNKNFFPESMYANPDFDTAYIRSHYSPVNVTKLLWNEDQKRIINFDDHTTAELKKAWLNLIGKAPADYLELRWEIYLYFLTIKKEEPLQYYFPWIHPNNYGFQVEESFLYRKYYKYMQAKEHKVYFQVWFWILLNILLFPAVFLIRDRVIKLFFLCVVSSGFLYTLPQLVVSNTVRDFRYIYWSCLACTIAILALIAERGMAYGKRMPPPPMPPAT